MAQPASSHHARPKDEAALIAAARRGDIAAFNQLVLLHQGTAYGVALRILGDADAAADATQDAFLAAFKAVRSLRTDSFRAWLLRIVANVCYDQLRRQQRLSGDFFGDPDAQDERIEQAQDPAERPDEYVVRSELNRALRDGILRLPAGLRSVVVLSDVHGLKYDEIAGVTGLELGTVKSRLSRGRAQLRDHLLRHGDLLPARYRPSSGSVRRPAPRPGGQSACQPAPC